MINVRRPARSHRTPMGRSRSTISSQRSAALAINDVRYPPLAYIDQTAQAGLSTRTVVIQKLLAAPKSLDSARNKNRTPVVQSASIDSLSGSAPVPKMTKLSAAAATSTDEKP